MVDSLEDVVIDCAVDLADAVFPDETAYSKVREVY